jgi:cell division protein FtsZ
MSMPRQTTSSRKAHALKAGASPASESSAQQTPAPVVEHKSEATQRRFEPAHRIRLKLFGVGGAGGNAVAQIAASSTEAKQALAGVELVAVNTDLQALEAVANAEKIHHALRVIQIGSAVTHGLGTGGDCELGARAAQQDTERLKAQFQNSDVVFIAAGLGGGTGTGASPVLARLAKEQGALVLAFVSMPFGFEGDRRRQQALAGLEQLKAQADAVICIQNDKLFKIVGENATVLDGFKRGNEIIASGVQAIWQLLSRKGLINLDFADLRTTLGSRHCQGIFSCGEAEGPDKARDAVKALMESPLLDGGEALARAEGVLVSILGGPDLTLTDVQRAVEPISRQANRAHIIMGAVIDENYRGRLAVTVIAAAANVARKNAQPIAANPFPLRRLGEAMPFRTTSAPAQTTPIAGSATTAAISEPAVQKKKESAKPRQETLPLEGVSHGRFDRSEPTLYEGEDLDVPTFLRRGISLKR